MTVIDGEFCLRMGAVHRSEPRSGRHSWLNGMRLWAGIPFQTL